MLVDSHCHLDMLGPDGLDQVLHRAAMAGVGEVVTISTRMAQSAGLIELAERHSGVWCTVGVHPHNAAELPMPGAASVAALARHPKVVGIGESGLDYFYDTAPRDVQQASFRVHIQAARLAGVPLVIHARDADADMERILREETEQGPFQFVMHCFSSGRALAEAAVELGGYVSFSGILTFPKSDALRDIARSLPHDRLLVETDAPYLAPASCRGKRNEPAWVAETAQVLANVLAMQPDDLADLTTANFRRLFVRTAV